MTKTIGISPKVIGQAAASAAVWALAHYGIQLDPEVSGAIATVVGFVAGFWLPNAPTVTVGVEDAVDPETP